MTDASLGSDGRTRASRRQLAVGALGIALSAGGFGFVYGLSARDAGFSPVEAMAMSTLVFAGAAQFAAVGYVASGLAWPGVILLTALLNARHLLYSAALAPWLHDTPRPRRALMAHLLTDEAFALSIAHFERLGRADERGYWVAAVLSTFIPWNLATFAGVTVGAQIPDPARLGLDVVFPAAMTGLAVGLITGRREVVAALGGAILGVASSLWAGPGVGVIVGGMGGPLLGMAVPRRDGELPVPPMSPRSAGAYAQPGPGFTPRSGSDRDAPGPPSDGGAGLP
jgi:4-azaleucine resistance transporter AzlC